MRNLASRPFEYLVAVIYSPTFSVAYAGLMPIEVVSELGRFSGHTNAQVFRFTRSVLDHPKVTDISSKLIAAQQGVSANEPA